jgi:RNA polymerase sigma factor (sigma-70 family)
VDGRRFLLCGFGNGGDLPTAMMIPPAIPDDVELLREYASRGEEDAFAELVRRQVNLVYAAALRQTDEDVGLAQDVTQAVFIELARQANRLCRHPALIGWLYTTTHHLAARAVRSKARRQRREQQARIMEELLGETPTHEADVGTSLRPFLDAAMHELGEADRLAILLRYFEQRPLAEVGARLGLTENAARMRVDRALDKLRLRLARLGVTSTTSAFGLALAGQASTAAPALLASTCTAAALTTATTTSTLGIISIMASTKLKLALTAVVAVGFVTLMVTQHQAMERRRAESAQLRRQLGDAEKELMRAAQRSADDEAELNRLRAGRTELLRLRGEIARLRSATPMPALSPGPATTAATAVEPTTGDENLIADLGNDTPEDATLTFFWALAAQQRDRFVELLKFPDDVSPAQATKLYDHLFRQRTNTYARWQFGQVLNLQTKDDATIDLKLAFHDLDTGRRDALSVNLRKYDSGWHVFMSDVPRENASPVPGMP